MGESGSANETDSFVKIKGDSKPLRKLYILYFAPFFALQ